jgi:signal transduction histidine kinase
VVYPQDFQTAMHHYLQFSVIPIIVVLLTTMILGNYFVKGMTAPLAAVAQVTKKIAERGNLTEHVPISTNDELGELAASFNWMVRQLRATHQDLKHSNKRLELSMRQLTGLNQEMEDLLHAVSHDLRAPLINIQGFAKRLERVTREMMDAVVQITQQDPGHAKQKVDELRQGVEPKMEESMQYISKGIEKMDVLLTQLLAISRVGRKSDPLEENDLNTIVDDVVATFNHQLVDGKIDVIRQTMPDKVYCRKNEINQVFANLISNAIKYMGDAQQRLIEIGGRVIESSQEVECYVADTGVGIEPENHERVFQTFTRLKRVDVPGEGVGLAYVRKVLRSHQGRIWVESAVGKGSKFIFRIPLRPHIKEGEVA